MNKYHDLRLTMFDRNFKKLDEAETDMLIIDAPNRMFLTYERCAREAFKFPITRGEGSVYCLIEIRG